MKTRGRNRDLDGESSPRRDFIRASSRRPGGRFRWDRVFLAAGTLFLLWQAAVFLFGLLFAEPVPAVYGTLEETKRVEAVIFRRERLILAPAEGRFLRHHPEGERIPRQGLVGVLERPKAKVKILAPAAGLLSYAFDGLEGWSPARVLAAPEEAYRAGQKSRTRPTAKGSLHRGEPLARLVDDERQYLVLPFSGERPPEAGKSLTIRTGDLTVPVVVAAASQQKKRVWLVLETGWFPPDWLDRRRITGELVLNRTSGTVVPLRYLFRRGQETGVLVLRRGRTVFRPVKVIASDRERAVVADLAPGTLLMPR
ncbi:MAG: HlyD family efflux transporter periplasmic adaptor subunit [Bacillota bacterium]